MLDIMRTARVVFLALLALDLMLGSTARDFALVGYMPEWRHEGADFDRLSSHLSHLVLFSAEAIYWLKDFSQCIFYVQVTPKGDIAGLDRLPRLNSLSGLPLGHSSLPLF